MDKEKTLVPKRRFVGFEEPWKDLKLFQLGDIITGSTPPTNKPEYYSADGIPWVTPTDINSNVTYRSAKHISKAGQKVAKIVPKDTILVTCIASIGKNTILRTKASFNQQINALIPNAKENDPYFLFTSSYFWSKKMKSSAASGTMQIVNKTEFSQISLNIPSTKEQTKIGEFFKTMDNLINLQQQKITKLKDLKSGYLNDMFPKEGESVPKLRFAGFEEPWAVNQLGNYTDIATGKLDANAMVKDGQYDFYTSGIKKYRIDEPAFKGPAITIAGNGATVGYMHLADGEFNAYQRTYVLSNFKSDRQFLYIEIERKLPNKIQQEARMGNIPYIVLDMLTDLEVETPNLKEQVKIGEFFRNLDSQIKLQEEKLEKLKQMKQAYLNEMFV